MTISSEHKKKRKAVILLSGGLDSATVAAIACKQYKLHALSFTYGQRHKIELQFAKKIVRFLNISEHKVINIDLATFGRSALTDNNIAVPKNHQSFGIDGYIPVTYVPARNTIFLAYALAYAEVIEASDIFLGVNAVDYSGYPDCRPAFIQAFENMANFATAAISKYQIHAPLIKLSKKEIIALGHKLGMNYAVTHSCYDPLQKGTKVYACGKCDSCQLRLKGFQENNLKDPCHYQNE